MSILLRSTDRAGLRVPQLLDYNSKPSRFPDSSVYSGTRLFLPFLRAPIDRGGVNVANRGREGIRRIKRLGRLL